jgi:hypothetical protein
MYRPTAAAQTGSSRTLLEDELNALTDGEGKTIAHQRAFETQRSETALKTYLDQHQASMTRQ